MRFVADIMLGRLAKRMRLLGFDVLYAPGFDDNELIRLSLEQGRIILTRDTGLAGRPLAANHLRIDSDHVHEQLRQVIEKFRLEQVRDALTRCSRCNAVLAPVTKQEARDLVPPYVYEKNEHFFRCAACKRIYWKGSHVRNMRLCPCKTETNKPSPRG